MLILIEPASFASSEIQVLGSQLHKFIKMFSTTTVSVLESFSYVSQIISAFSVLLIFLQLRASLKDMSIRSRREAGLMSMKQAEKFASEIMPADSSIDDRIKSQKITLDERRVKIQLSSGFKIAQAKQIGRLGAISDSTIAADITTLLNKLEALSMVFTSGMGDENMVFPSLSKAFCSLVEKYYFIIDLLRNEEGGGKLYDSLIRLYSTWDDRIEKEKINTEVKKLIESAKKIKDNPIHIIGT